VVPLSQTPIKPTDSEKTPKPESTKTFASLKLPPDLLAVVQELGYTHPTQIQLESIPLLLAGKDVVGQSRTGSGKTAAFGLPILSKVRVKARRLQALILCPTRELCAQVAREMRKLGRRHPGLQVLELAGGQPIRPQIFSLEKGAHIAVGTPGRVLDHLRRDVLDLKLVSTVVLDEADRMLDMGFEEDMQQILAALPEKRQTVLFSATFPPSIEVMSNSYQSNPIRVAIDSGEQKSPAIRQIVFETTAEEKVETLLRVLQDIKPQSAIVFCNFKIVVADVVKSLSTAGISAGALHGDLEQFDRDRMMAKFRNRSVRVLVATDVAARGIDVEALDLVVNLDLPSKPDTYVHRIGRSGRAGKEGLAVSIATARENFKIERIEEFTGVTVERKRTNHLPPLEVKAAAASGEASMVTFMIGGGRKEKLRPGDILGALTGEAGGLEASQIGKIEIHDHFSYVAVAAGISRTALQRLQDGKIKGRYFSVKLVP
jgi:ATP-independent RNA helicase DbpA